MEIGAALLGILVEPVRGHPLLGDMMHFPGTDLHLDRRAEGADQRRVQRLVVIGLGNRDVVLELARHRLVQTVQHAEREVAGGHIGDDDAEAVDIEHLRERETLLTHLAIDRVETLLAPEDLGVEPGAGQLADDAILNARQQFMPVAARSQQGLGQHLGAVRMNQAKGNILQFAVQLAEAEAQGDRRVDLEGLDGNAPALVGAHRRHRLQVVLTVGQFDQHDAQVTRHGHQHLAEVFRLRLLIRGEFHLVELGQAIDQISNLATEFLGQFALAGSGVFQHIVQQRGDHRVGIHSPFDHGAGHCQRMGDVRLARQAPLTGMRARRKGKRLLDAVYVSGGEIFETVEENPVGGFLRGGRQRRRRWIHLASPPPTSGLTAIQHFQAKLAERHFAQRDDRRLVAVGLDHRRCAVGDLACPVGCRQSHLEAVGNLFQAIVNRYAGHATPLNQINRAKRAA